jgi:uncharacterized caspase-like protein
MRAAAFGDRALVRLGLTAVAAAMLASLCLAAAAQEARPLRGVALVIGNAAYEPALLNPANDARAVEKLLSELGFKTTVAADLTARQLSRTLDGFIEDAEDADVAVVWYAGHGIEAGGENFLVPVDADLSALETAGESLVPVSGFLSRLQATVPVTIVMLDACRDNPFPPGATMRLEASVPPVAMRDVGLGETRGAMRLSAPQQGAESLGTVLAYAAAPGKKAQDGEPGQNSPYATAILRHLDAMAAGREFGTVMRMISEEVYLKTSGGQRPWVNESLHRLLYFGRAPAPVIGEQGEILAERRQLLVTIAALPDLDPRRTQMERIASEGGVALDTVYGMLRALGQDVPADSAELETLLRSQTERLKEILAERETLKSTDAEIARLAALADEAIDEGALATALRVHDRAKARAVELLATIEGVEADIRTRRSEFAEVFARSAKAFELAFDHERAAADYQTAFEIIRKTDRRRAGWYRLRQSHATKNIGYAGSNFASLEAAVKLARDAADILEDDPWHKAMALRFVGDNLHALGWHRSDAGLIREAIDAFRHASAIETHENAPPQWAENQHYICRSLEYLSWLMEKDETTSKAMLWEAHDHCFRAMEIRTREQSPSQWASTASLAVVVLYRLARIEPSPDLAIESIKLAQGAAEIITPAGNPEGWASVQGNLAGAFRIHGHLTRASDADAAAQSYRESIHVLRNVLAIQDNAPLPTANNLNNLGGTYYDLWQVSRAPEALEGALDAYRQSLSRLEGLDADRLRATAISGLSTVLAELGEDEIIPYEPE